MFPRSEDVDRLVSRGRFEEAASRLREHLAERPGSVRLRKRLAHVLEMSGRQREAGEILARLAEDLASDGFVAQAIAAFKKMERLDPASGGVDQRIALLITEREEARAAEQEAPRPGEVSRARAADSRVERVPRSVLLSPLFSDFSSDELVDLIEGLNLTTYEPGEIVVTEGEVGDSLFQIVSGRVRVYVRNSLGGSTQVRNLGPSAFFGEISLLTGRRRTATIVAADTSELLVLDRETVLEIGRRKPRVQEVIRQFCVARTRADAERAAEGRLELVI